MHLLIVEYFYFSFTMSVERCNIEGVMDALFREFLSQPGERQQCSELLHSIAKGNTNSFFHHCKKISTFVIMHTNTNL